jgi:multiple sugar transport system ATP-binding protein
LREEVLLLHRQLGLTTIYVTHDQTEALPLAQRIAVMHRGRLEQVDPPLEVYGRPATAFVAGFLGSPPMNLWPGTLTRTREQTVFSTDDNTLRIVLSRIASSRDLALQSGRRSVILGVRPEDIRWSVTADSTAHLISGKVLHQEFLGSRVAIRMKVAEDIEVVFLTSPDAVPAVGTTVAADFPLDRVHLFDAETGLRLG